MTRISRISLQTVSALGALSLLLASGCSTKNYVRSQTTPVIQKTNELDDATATNNRNIHDVDQRAQAGITQAQSSANQANQAAQSAGTAASQANQSAQEAVNRADSLASVVGNLDNYKQIADAQVNFGFDKADLTRADKQKLDRDHPHPAEAIVAKDAHRDEAVEKGADVPGALEEVVGEVV